MQPLANCTEELKLFREIVTGKNPNRIFLIEGESGIGKTSLLSQFHAQCPSDIPCVSIDLKSTPSGIHYIFNTLRRRLGSENFSNLDNQVKEFLKGDNINVTVSENELRGENQKIQVVLNFDRDTEKLLRNVNSGFHMSVPISSVTESDSTEHSVVHPIKKRDESIRESRLSAMTNALFQDLRKIEQSICLIFDTFNQASYELKSWLGGEFLSEVADSRNLRIVIAGQQVPNPTIEWMNLREQRCLEAINNVEEWWAFAQNERLTCPKDAVKAITLAFDGKPDDIVKTLTAVARKW